MPVKIVPSKSNGGSGILTGSERVKLSSFACCYKVR